MRRKIKRLIPTLRIPTVTRIGINRELKKHFKRLKPGRVLDVGSKHSPYIKILPKTKYLRLDLSNESAPDICCNLENVKWKSEDFDTIIATEVFEHLEHPEKATDEIHRLLKRGGVCIMSTRFIYPYHADPKDYYRYTWDSLNSLFNKFSKVKVIHHGNAFQSIWEIFNSRWYVRIFLNIFNPLVASIKSKKTKFPLGFVVIAKK